MKARNRRWLAGAAVVTALGVVLVGTGHAGLGGVMLVAGWVLLGFEVHRLGREG